MSMNQAGNGRRGIGCRGRNCRGTAGLPLTVAVGLPFWKTGPSQLILK